MLANIFLFQKCYIYIYIFSLNMLCKIWIFPWQQILIYCLLGYKKELTLEVQWVRVSNKTGVSLPLPKDGDIFSFWNTFSSYLEFWTMEKSRYPVILCVIHYCQNPVDYSFFLFQPVHAHICIRRQLMCIDVVKHLYSLQKSCPLVIGVKLGLTNKWKHIFRN
jgi:hypothetical protein